MNIMEQMDTLSGQVEDLMMNPALEEAFMPIAGEAEQAGGQLANNESVVNGAMAIGESIGEISMELANGVSITEGQQTVNEDE